MKKLLLAFILYGCLALTGAGQEPGTPPPAPREEKKGMSSAIWISLGVVMFVLILAANKRKRDRANIK